MKIKKEYERWLANAVADTDVAAELKAMDYVEVEDAFYRDLAFGTGGLRGVIGAGTNRMNIYTVAKASQGLADYLKKHFKEPSVAILPTPLLSPSRRPAVSRAMCLQKSQQGCLQQMASVSISGLS